MMATGRDTMTKSKTQSLIASQQEWMAARGATLDGYLKNYGDDGRKYFKCDQQVLRDLYRQKN